MSSGLSQRLARREPLMYKSAIANSANRDRITVNRSRPSLIAATTSLLGSGQFPAPSPRHADLFMDFNNVSAARRAAGAIFPVGREFPGGSSRTCPRSTGRSTPATAAAGIVLCCRGTIWRAAMTDADAVLAANLEFYRAFTTRDIAAMEAIWARHASVGCIHPGWPALAERDA